MAYIALGQLQQSIGLEAGMGVGFAMVVPAALIALIVLARGRRLVASVSSLAI